MAKFHESLLEGGGAYKLYKKHGTCLRGLLDEGFLPTTEAAIDGYLEAVHDVPLHGINPDPALREMLLRINLPRWVFTASVAPHAKRCLKLLGIEDLFEGIIDCKACNHHSKHSLEAFQAAMEIAGVEDPNRCIFFDDNINNIKTAKLEAGWATVLVGNKCRDSQILLSCPEADYIVNSIHEIEQAVPGLFTTDTELHSPMMIQAEQEEDEEEPCSGCMISSDAAAIFTLTGVPEMQHMLSVALVAEYSGLKWTAQRCVVFSPTALTSPHQPHNITKTIAIVNVIASLTKECSFLLHGDSGNELGIGQMLLAEGEELLHQLKQLTHTQTSQQEKDHQMNKFFSHIFPEQCLRLESYITSYQWKPAFQISSSSSSTISKQPLAGELHLFAMIHQAILLKTPAPLLKNGQAPMVREWYVRTLTDNKVQSVLRGESPLGSLTQSFVHS